MIACGSGYARLDFGLAVGDRPARQYRDPTIDIAPGRHAGGPVATLDDARIEIDRMGHSLEVSIIAGTLVPFGLELFQRLQQMVSRRDRVRARTGLEHVHGMSTHFQAKPDYAHLRAHHLAGSRLGNETGVGAIPALQRGERAHPCTFFLDHGLEVDAGGRLETCGLDRIQGIELAYSAALHIASAAAIHSAVFYHRRKRRGFPHFKRSGRHHVAMALQDQRVACVARRPIGADHRAGFREIMFNRAEAAQIFQIVDIDMPIIDLVIALPQKVADHVLARSFRAARGRNCDKISRGCKLRVEVVVNGGENPLFGVVVNHFRLFRSSLSESRPPAYSADEITCAMETRMALNRNVLYLEIGALIVAVGALSYNLYQTNKEPEGLQINVGSNGLKIKSK